MGNSFHLPVVFSVKLPNECEVQRVQFKTVLKQENLQNPNILLELKETIQPLIDSIKEEILREIEDCKWNECKRRDYVKEAKSFNNQIESKINNIIQSSTEKICGTRSMAKVSKNFVTQNSKTLALENRLNALHKLQKKNKNELVQIEKSKVLQELEVERNQIKKESFEAFEAFALSFAKGTKQARQKCLKKIIRAKLGNQDETLNNDLDSMNKAAIFFQKQFKNDDAKRVTFCHDWNLKNDEAYDIAEEIFKNEIVLNHLKYSPLRKAPGPSAITNEILSALADVLAPCFTCWFQFCLISGTIPVGWNETIIVPIYKKGNKSEIQNYRPISLLENIRKVFERCVEYYMKQKMTKLQIQQGGFQEGRSTLDQVVCLEQIINCYKKQFGKLPIVSYLDIKAAYDSVDRQILYENCLNKGINPIVVESIKQLFEHNRARININGKNSRSINMTSGVQQGSILSPLLYSIFIDKIITKLKESAGLLIDNTINMNCLLYADDIAIVASNVKDMNMLLKTSVTSCN